MSMNSAHYIAHKYGLRSVKIVERKRIITQQTCIKCIKSDSKGFYIVTKNCKKEVAYCSFEISIHQKKNSRFPQKYSTLIIIMFIEQKISIFNNF